MLQLGLNPLCVTATTCDLSEIGRKNIENIKHLGVDYMEFSPNPQVRAQAESDRAHATSATSRGPSTSASSRSRCALPCSSTCR